MCRVCAGCSRKEGVPHNHPQGEVSVALATLQSAYPYFMGEEAEAGEGGASAQVNS